MINYKIKKENVEDIFALSPIQEGILFHYLKTPESTQYFEQLCIVICGDFQRSFFEKAWHEVVKNNEMLRVVFRWEDTKNPIQIVLNENYLDIYYYDLTGEEESKKINMLEDIKKSDKSKMFDLHLVPFRISLCKMDDMNYSMIISNHHIIYDGWSNGIILSEFFGVYNALIKNENYVFKNKAKYKEFIKYFQKSDISSDKEFWESYLEGYSIKEILPLNMQNQSESEKCNHCSIEQTFSYELKNKIDNFINNTGVTLASLFYSAWGILLGKYTYSEDVIFGVSLSIRDIGISNVDNSVGLYLNTLPLRVVINNDYQVVDLINNVHKSFVDIYSHNSSTLLEINKYCKIRGNEKLFDSLVVIENYAINEIAEKENLLIESFSIDEQTSYNLTLDVMLFDNYAIKLSYNPKLFYNEFVRNMLIHYTNIINFIVELPHGQICKLDYLGAFDKKLILKDFINKKVDFSKEHTIYHLIERNAKDFPQRTAISFNNTDISYKELNENSNRIAHFLKSRGAGREEKIAILLERSDTMISSILATWKIGGLYIPIDPNYPEERKLSILKNSQVNFVITNSNEYNRLKKHNFENIFITDLSENELTECSVDNLNLDFDINSLAYVIYTSGSTGEPKGVMVEHIGMMNHLYAKINDLGITEKSVVAQNASHCFDISIWQFFAALVTGGKVVIYLNGLVLDTDKFIDSIIRDKVTILEVVPVYLLSMLDFIKQRFREFTNLEYIISTGEKLNKKLVERWFEHYPDIKMVNAYGPTEASDDITHHFMNKAPKNSNVPVGKPIQNFNIYIADKTFNLCPVDVVGEICVSGIGVGRGYLNDSKKTGESFLKDPFEKDHDLRLYRTGDLGRWNKNGEIELLGRLDNQIKVNGFRIELDEIEHHLLCIQEIKEVVVLLKENSFSDKYLCAYYVSEKDFSYSEMKAYLRKRIPNYMIPKFFIKIDSFPVSSNGKIDKKKLPEPTEYLNKEAICYSNDVEILLDKIWRQVLNINNYTFNGDDDFLEFGGDSLKVTRLRSMIHKELNVDIPLADFFTVSTFKGQTELIQNSQKSYFTLIPKQPKREFYELSYNQKRIWVIYNLDTESPAWNMFGRITIVNNQSKDTVLEVVSSVLEKLVERHESLRTGITIKSGEPVQFICDRVKIPIGLVDIADLPCQEKKTKRDEIYREESNKPFKLHEPPLFRALILYMGDNNYDLIFNFHHIISDGWSMEILKKEFFQIYNALLNGKNIILEPLEIQYKDFAVWHNRGIKDKEMQKKAHEYWTEKLTRDLPIVRLSIHTNENISINYGGGYISFIDNSLKNKLVNRANDNNVTLFSIMFTAFNIFLSYASGQSELLCGIPAAGREHVFTQNIVGFFINPIPIKTNIDYHNSFEELLPKVEKEVREALVYQNYPLELVLDELKMKFPDIRIFFDMLNQKQDEREQELDSFESYHPQWVQDAKYDLYLLITEYKNGIEVFWNYRKALFDSLKIEKFADIYLKILSRI